MPLYDPFREVEQIEEAILKEIRSSVDTVKKLQIETNAFNSSQRFAVFGVKLVVMGAVVFSGFATIQFFHDDHLFGICNILVVINGTLGYTFCYDRGFTVPRTIARLQNLLTLRLKMLGGVPALQQAYAERQLKSLRKMAVQVGDFHTLQRVSTPNFLDFCFKNTARLVMFYTKYVHGL